MISAPKEGRRHDFFLSYDAEDEQQARLVAKELEQHRLTCFLAQRDLRTGEDFYRTIEGRLQHCNEVIVLFTPKSRNSPWVFYEVGFARAHYKFINAVLLDLSPDELNYTPINRFHAARRNELDMLVRAYRERSHPDRGSFRHQARERLQEHETLFNEKLHGLQTAVSKYVGVLREGLQETFPKALVHIEKNPSYKPELQTLPSEWADRILIHTIHAGDHLPKEFQTEVINKASRRGRNYRDWGPA